MWVMFFQKKVSSNFFIFSGKNENILTKYFSQISFFFPHFGNISQKKGNAGLFDRKIRNPDSNSHQYGI
jgi:hypothetical protein